jgi:hypothetical protein
MQKSVARRVVRFVSKTGEELKSRTERKWDKDGPEIIREVFEKEVVWEKYEPFKLHIGNAWYRVDWAFQLESGEMVLVEVKESMMQPNVRDSLTRVLVASGLFPMFEWIVAFPQPLKSGGGWKIRRMVGDKWEDGVFHIKQGEI